MTAYRRSHVRRFSSALQTARRVEFGVTDRDAKAADGVQRASGRRPIGWADIVAAYWTGVPQARQEVAGGESRDCGDDGMPVESGLPPNFTGMSTFDVC